MVMSLAIPPLATVVADRAIPAQCIRLAREAGLPERLSPQQVELALALLDRSTKTTPEIRRCREAVGRLRMGNSR